MRSGDPSGRVRLSLEATCCPVALSLTADRILPAKELDDEDGLVLERNWRPVMDERFDENPEADEPCCRVGGWKRKMG